MASEREAEARTLMERVPGNVLGARLRRARQRMGLSIRELAKVADVGKNSIVRLEQGSPALPGTVLKVCRALGVHIASMTRTDTSESQIVSIHRAADDRWFELTDFGEGPLEGQDRPLSEAERHEMVQRGAQVPLLILRSRLETGRLLPTVIELYRQSESRSHAGEEFVYVLEGRATITVGPESFDLKAGEAATFWSAEEHFYAPAKDAALPVRVLSVRIDDKPTRA